MATYEHFARHYDALLPDPLANAARVRGYLARHAPHARSLLELGCGTGAVLAGLRGSVASLAGLDRSPAMLARAHARAPSSRLIEADMTAFDLGERFDAVICVFDTLNHLARFEQWLALFDRAAAHLHEGGLFAFDVNTAGQLRRLAAAGAWTVSLPAAVVSQEVEALGDGLFLWHVRITESGARGGIVRHHERILELAVELAALDTALAPAFERLERSDGEGGAPNDESARAYFAYRRR